MSGLLYLIPVAIGLGILGLVAFLWSLKSAQFEDLDGAANRILFEDEAPENENSSAAAASDPVADNRPPAEGPPESG